MSVGVGLAGDAELIARLDHAHAGILDLSDANRDAVRLVENKANTLVPRASGALAHSVTATVTGSGWGIAYSKPYAVPVHAVRPWLWGAATSTEDSWMDALTEHVQQLLN